MLLSLRHLRISSARRPSNSLYRNWGPPCQDFSVMRGVEQERGGIKTLRGKLYLQFARYLAVLKPLAFVFENVPGLLSSNSGRDISAILEDITNLELLPNQWIRQYEAEPNRTPPPPKIFSVKPGEGKYPPTTSSFQVWLTLPGTACHSAARGS